ncbi:hypothetical protein PIROE2DRAFT_6972 [Piromyces sp. E2]|nr:hypothetical protein PIROE2DRAFT_6972 [Piromyces sp. E2]|eukprot:OUM65904.1 hypothetical protein PIROE2DRAFT_6972 [Piromyces sp. E2]
MINVKNKIGYLIDNSSFHTKNKFSEIQINTSYFENINTLINGKEVNSYIKNSKFYNINNLSAYPTLINTLYGRIILENCSISNIMVYGYSIFSEETDITLSNVIISNITSNHKNVISSILNNFNLFNITFNNINIYGDFNDSSLIEISTENINKNITLNNIQLLNINANGNIINMKGTNAFIHFNNIIMKNITSFGPIIKSTLNNVNIKMESLIFENNSSIDKYSKGLININNNINIDLLNSKFNNNKSYNSGVIYFGNINSLNGNINNCTFNNNIASGDGGVFYINNQNKLNGKLLIEKTSFNKNHVNLFGGVIYMNEYNNENNIILINNNFTNNYAGIAGGSIFITNINKHNASYLNKIIYNNNLFNMNYAGSHGLNIGSNPVKLIFDDNNTNTNIKFLPGNPISLTLKVYDLFDNLIIDNEKYFSNIGLDMKLFDINDNLINDDIYKITNNEISIEKGNILVVIKIYIKEPGKYKLKFNLKSKVNNIIYDNGNTVELFVESLDCNQSDIKKEDNNNMLYICEKPICMKCDTDKNFDCIKRSDTVNNPKINICQCSKGWKGERCDEYDFYNIKKLKIIKTSGILSSTIITIGNILLCITEKNIIAHNFKIMFNNSKKDMMLLEKILSKNNYDFIINKDYKFFSQSSSSSIDSNTSNNSVEENKNTDKRRFSNTNLKNYRV